MVIQIRNRGTRNSDLNVLALFLQSKNVVVLDTMDLIISTAKSYNWENFSPWYVAPQSHVVLPNQRCPTPTYQTRCLPYAILMPSDQPSPMLTSHCGLPSARTPVRFRKSCTASALHAHTAASAQRTHTAARADRARLRTHRSAMSLATAQRLAIALTAARSPNACTCASDRLCVDLPA